MSRRPSLLVLCTVLSSGCTQTYEDRIDELEERAGVDCGTVNDCDTPERANAVITCMQENLAAGVRAKAFFILGLDPVAYIYTDGTRYISVEGWCDGGDDCTFMESVCRDLATTATCGLGRVTAEPVDCEVVRDW